MFTCGWCGRVFAVGWCMPSVLWLQPLEHLTTFRGLLLSFGSFYGSLCYFWQDLMGADTLFQESKYSYFLYKDLKFKIRWYNYFFFKF